MIIKIIILTLIIVLIPLLLFADSNERPIEYAFALHWIAEEYPSKVLDVGVGGSPLPALIQWMRIKVVATDIAIVRNKHFSVTIDDITKTNLSPESFDMVLCISTLEHIPDADKAVENMFKLLKNDGLLILTFPYTEDRYIDNVYKLVNLKRPYICQSFNRENLNGWIRKKGKIIEQTYYDCWKGEFWRKGKQVIPPQKTSKTKDHDMTCIAIRKTKI